MNSLTSWRVFSINTARMVSSNSKLSSKTYTRVKTINNSKNWNRSSTMLEIFTTLLLVKISPLFPTISTLLSLKRLVSVSGMISSPMNSNALMFISLKSTLLLVVLTSKRSSKSSPSSITPMTKELTSTNGSTLLKNTKSILTKKVESATKKSITSKRKSKTDPVLWRLPPERMKVVNGFSLLDSSTTVTSMIHTEDKVRVLSLMKTTNSKENSLTIYPLVLVKKSERRLDTMVLSKTVSITVKVNWLSLMVVNTRVASKTTNSVVKVSLLVMMVLSTKVNGRRVFLNTVESFTTMVLTIKVSSSTPSSRMERVSYLFPSPLFPMLPLLLLISTLNTLMVNGKRMVPRVLRFSTYWLKPSAMMVNWPTGPSLVRARECTLMVPMKVNS